MPYAGQDFPVATTAEKVTYFFDFTGMLASGETILSASVVSAVAVDSEVFDPSSSDIVSGGSSITGNIVGQQFTNLVNGVKYLVTFTATTSQGNILIPYSHFIVDIPA
jgi:hypothetical protein